MDEIYQNSSNDFDEEFIKNQIANAAKELMTYTDERDSFTATNEEITRRSFENYITDFLSTFIDITIIPVYKLKLWINRLYYETVFIYRKKVKEVKKEHVKKKRKICENYLDSESNDSFISNSDEEDDNK